MSEITETTREQTGEAGPDKTEDRPAEDRTAELEETVTALQEKTAALERSLAEREQQLADTARDLSLAVVSYTAQVISANPQIPPELITGQTVAAVDSSVQTARALVNKVREGLETEIKTARIPAGAPLRTSADLSALSPREKIRHGIVGR